MAKDISIIIEKDPRLSCKSGVIEEELLIRITLLTRMLPNRVFEKNGNEQKAHLENS